MQSSCPTQEKYGRITALLRHLRLFLPPIFCDRLRQDKGCGGHVTCVTQACVVTPELRIPTCEKLKSISPASGGAPPLVQEIRPQASP